jgi:signal transduction histidine kinase
VLERAESVPLSPTPVDQVSVLSPPPSAKPFWLKAESGDRRAFRKAARTRPAHLLELACRAVGAALGGFGLLGPDGQLAEFVTFGLPEEQTTALRRSPWPLEVIQLVLRQPLPTRLPKEEGGRRREESDKVIPDSSFLLSPSSFLGVPITGPGRCRGALFLLRGPDGPAFGPDDEALVAPLTAWLEEGDLFDEARLFTQVRLIDQIAQAAAGNLDLSRIFQVVLRELDRHLPLHVSAVWLLDEVTGAVLSGEWCPPPTGSGSALDPDRALHTRLLLADASAGGGSLGLVSGRHLPLPETPFADCLATGQAVYGELASSDQESRASQPAASLTAQLAAGGANSWFAVPLRGGDRLVGILQTVCTRPTGFTNEQIKLLYLAADLLGPAIDNCQLFAQLRRAYEELRAAQSQLIHTEKMRALGELAGGMAHEFNNSLCGVLGFLELTLGDPMVCAASRGFLELARTCALDAARTVRRVQDFSRQRQDETAVLAIDVDELVRETVELTRHKREGLAQARGASVTMRVLAESAATVSGQPGELREVLTNLIFNAVDAMPHGGTLTVRAWSEGTDVLVAVQDTGVGIRDGDRRRLFEPFFTTKAERGNGLGLSVTFAIVRRHGGDISVASQVGRGSTFTVRLPAASPPAATAESGPAETVPDAVGLRVLVVEDEEPIRGFLSACLTGLGHRPRLTTDARTALAALAEEPFDVVLTDLGLPGRSGEEVARAAARCQPPPPVVLLTGWAEQLRAERITVEGVRRVLGKPVTIDALRQVLAEVVN